MLRANTNMSCLALHNSTAALQQTRSNSMTVPAAELPLGGVGVGGDAVLGTQGLHVSQFPDTRGV